MQGPRSSIRRWLAIAAIAFFVGTAAMAPRCASAQTDPSARFITMLATSAAFRVRASAATLLGGVAPSPAVTQALISALRDEDASVRAAAAQSLGRVGDSSALSGLRALSSDSAPAVRAAATAAIAAITARGPSSRPPPSGTGTSPPSGGPARFYIGVGDPGSTVAGIDPSLLTSARTTVVSTITPMSGVVVAPAGQTVAAARTAIAAQHLHGYFLDVSITDLTTRPDGNIHAAVSIVVQDYPSHSIRSMLSGAATAGGVSGLSGQRAALQAATAAALRSLATALGSP